MNITPRVLTAMFLPLMLLASACYVEGNSFFLSEGEERLFLTLDACRSEANALHSDGSHKYSGFRCRSKFAFFEISNEEIALPNR